MIKFSVVLPAYNEETVIAQAVRSLLRQSFPTDQYEIIVVDNNSKDRTSEAARQAGAHLVIREEKKGTNMARNRGYLESRGEIIAFLDSDSEAPRDWLRMINDILQDDRIVAVSGPYDLGFKGIRGFGDYLYQRFFLPHIPFFLKLFFRKRAGVLIGGNFAVRKTALDHIGGLPPLSFWGDDATLAMMLVRAEGRVVFDPMLRVKSSPRRFRKEGFFRLTVLYIRAYLKAYFNVPGR